MIEAFRRELDLPHVPILVGGLGEFLADCPLSDLLKNYPYVNDALERVAQTTPMTGFVTAEGLGANPDQLHFSARSLYEFGLRNYHAFEAIAAQDDPQRPAVIMDDTKRSNMELL